MLPPPASRDTAEPRRKTRYISPHVSCWPYSSSSHISSSSLRLRAAIPPARHGTLPPPRYHATSAPKILSAYVYYIPTMAFNGVLEAFLASACTPRIARAEPHDGSASLGFVLTAVGLARGLAWGDAGLVWANIANLGARAIYSWVFVRRYFSRGYGAGGEGAEDGPARPSAGGVRGCGDGDSVECSSA